MPAFLPVLIAGATLFSHAGAAPLVASFDPLTLQPLGAFSLAATPNSIAFGNGSLFAASSSGLARYSPSGALQVALTPPGGFRFSNLTFDGYLYAAVELSGTRVVSRISEFDSNGFMQQPFLSLEAAPLSVTHGGTSTFVAYPFEIAEYDSAGTQLALYNSGGQFSIHPLAFYQSLYAAVTNAGVTSLSEITHFSGAAFTEVVLAMLPAIPAALFAGDTGIYAAYGDGTLERYGFDGTLLASITQPGVAWTAATLGNGTLYAAGDAPSAAIPEPGTALTAISALLLLAVVRQRS